MGCWKDTTFCAKDCRNLKCNRNRHNIPKDLDCIVSICNFENCEYWSGDNEQKSK